MAVDNTVQSLFIGGAKASANTYAAWAYWDNYSPRIQNGDTPLTSLSGLFWKMDVKGVSSLTSST